MVVRKENFRASSSFSAAEGALIFSFPQSNSNPASFSSNHPAIFIRIEPNIGNHLLEGFSLARWVSQIKTSREKTGGLLPPCPWRKLGRDVWMAERKSAALSTCR